MPFYLRTGKRLGKRVTEVAVVFKRAPHLPFDDTATEELGQNAIVIRIQPDEGVTIRFGSKVPGAQMEVRDVTMDFGYGNSFTETSPRPTSGSSSTSSSATHHCSPARGGRAVLAHPRPAHGVLGPVGRARAL